MTRPKDHKICPLYYMCSGSEYDKDGCIGAPWEEPLCSFTIVSSPFSLNKKQLHGDFKNISLKTISYYYDDSKRM